MTLPQKERNRSSLREPDAYGWYIYTVGEEVRCPGPAHKTSRFDGSCGKYLGTVTEGQMCVRIESDRRTPHRAEQDRRHYPRFTKRCPHRDGCGTPLEIETRSLPDEAA